LRIVEQPGAPPLMIVLPHGTTVMYSPAGRRLYERDRHGHELTRLAWREDGALAEARVRIPDGSWLTIEPGATSDAPWGRSDRLWHRGVALTVFEAVDYTHLASIPTLAEPARLPLGGGTAVLNLIASLASDQPGGHLFYRGPYPSEELFLALLESFHYCGGDGDPLHAFMAGELAWIPAPHERLLSDAGIWIQLRDRIEKVVWEGRPYYRTAWQGVQRHAARRVRDADGRVVCSLWALGAVLEDHLNLTPDAGIIEIVSVARSFSHLEVAPAAVLPGIAAAVAARSAPALGPFILDSVVDLALEWGPVSYDLVAVHGTALRVSNRLLHLARTRLAAATTGEQRVNIGLAVLGEAAHLVGDVLRARAQARLAALPAEAQAAAFAADPRGDLRESARALANAVQALLAWGPLRDGVQDQLDVEGHEGADR
jgi:hypothetical protein